MRFCDGGEMAEEKGLLERGLSNSVGIGIFSNTKLMSDKLFGNRFQRQIGDKQNKS